MKNKSSMNQELQHYLAAGHGRGYEIVKAAPEKYRKYVMDLCLRDSSFDLQSEGSRAAYAYDLSMLYHDYTPFMRKAIQQFMSESTVADWHATYHLCDLLMLYAFESHEKSAAGAIWLQYEKLYKIMMTKRFSYFINEVCQCYELIAISLIGQYDWECTEKIARDLGAWFLRRRTAEKDGLKWQFSWLWSCMNSEYGEEQLLKRLKRSSAGSKEIRRFLSVMYLKEGQEPGDTGKEKAHKKVLCTAEDVLEAIKKDEFPRFWRGKYKISTKDKIKIAKAAVEESDLRIKAKIVNLFTYPRFRWPISTKHLIDWYEIACKKTKRNEPAEMLNAKESLRSAVCDAMCCLQDDDLYRFVKGKIAAGEKEYMPAYVTVDILINNFHREDGQIVLDFLNSIPIDREDRTGWHGIVLDIVSGEEKDVPEEFLIWVYENSLCSHCRENAVEELIKKGAFPIKYRQECQYDSNLDIRQLVQQSNS